MLNSILTIILVGVLFGLILWIVTNFVPMDGRIKSVVAAVAVVLFLVWTILALSGQIPVWRLG